MPEYRSATATHPDADAPNLDHVGRTPYVSYTEVDVLSELVHPVTDEPLEVTFIVVTQLMELHFTLLIHEWRLAIAALDSDDLPSALAALQRAVVTQDSLIQSWSLLSVMSAVQYNRFRDSLGEASGFQSFSYRELEFLIGAKNPRMLNPHSGMPKIHQRLRDTYEAPSLYDAALALLGRHGFAIPDEVLARDVREPWLESHPAVVEAWRQVYSSEAPDSELMNLAELLTSTAERYSTWRFVHYTAVRRILGGKPGTAGSAGMAWLKRTVDAPVFADLWDVRSVL